MSLNEEGIPHLTSEQWAGLARLGDLANRGETFERKSFLDLPLELADKADDMLEDLDPKTEVSELMKTLKVLRESGLLALIGDNAAFIAESVQLLKPVIPELLNKLKGMPVTEIISFVQSLGALIPKVNAVITFLQGPAGNDIVAKIKELGDIWEETSADTTMVQALRLLKQLQDDGNLQRISDLSRQIGLFAENIDLNSMAGQFILKSEKNSALKALTGLTHSSRLMAEALSDAAEHEAKGSAGGITGLYHMLKDPDVQRGMRVMAVLPIYLERAGVLPKHKS